MKIEPGFLKKLPPPKRIITHWGAHVDELVTICLIILEWIRRPRRRDWPEIIFAQSEEEIETLLNTYKGDPETQFVGVGHGLLDEHKKNGRLKTFCGIRNPCANDLVAVGLNIHKRPSLRMLVGEARRSDVEADQRHFEWGQLIKRRWRMSPPKKQDEQSLKRYEEARKRRGLTILETVMDWVRDDINEGVEMHRDCKREFEEYGFLGRVDVATGTLRKAEETSDASDIVVAGVITNYTSMQKYLRGAKGADVLFLMNEDTGNVQFFTRKSKEIVLEAGRAKEIIRQVRTAAGADPEEDLVTYRKTIALLRRSRIEMDRPLAITLRDDLRMEFMRTASGGVRTCLAVSIKAAMIPHIARGIIREEALLAKKTPEEIETLLEAFGRMQLKKVETDLPGCDWWYHHLKAGSLYNGTTTHRQKATELEPKVIAEVMCKAIEQAALPPIKGNGAHSDKKGKVRRKRKSASPKPPEPQAATE